MILRIAGAVLMFLHGFGHVQGVIAGLGHATVEGHHPRSWLLTPLTGETTAKILVVIIYAACMALWMAAALSLVGLLVPHELWRTLTTAAAIISIIAVLLFWNALMLPFNRIAALVVDLGALVALYWLHWPSEADLGL
jgi:hypothetical protein